MPNHGAIFFPGNTSLLTRSEVVLDCRSVRESKKSHHGYAERSPILESSTVPGDSEYLICTYALIVWEYEGEIACVHLGWSKTN